MSLLGPRPSRSTESLSVSPVRSGRDLDLPPARCLLAVPVRSWASKSVEVFNTPRPSEFERVGEGTGGRESLEGARRSRDPNTSAALFLKLSFSDDDALILAKAWSESERTPWGQSALLAVRRGY